MLYRFFFHFMFPTYDTKKALEDWNPSIYDHPRAQISNSKLIIQ